MKKLFLIISILVLMPACARKKTHHEEMNDFLPPDCNEEVDIEDLVDMEEPALDSDGMPI